MKDQSLLNPDNSWQNLQEKLLSWYENLLLFLPNFLLALLIVILFLVIGRFVSRFIRRITLRLKLSQELSGLFATLGYLMIGGIGLFAALGILNLNKTVTSLLAGAGIIGLFLSLAFQNVAINVLSGAIISVRRPIAVGDVVKSNDYFGVVAYINWRTTHLITFQGQYVHIPNKEMIELPVANYTKYGIRRVEFTMRIAYDEDLNHVRSVALNALENVPDRLKAYPPEFYLEEFESDAITARALFWIDYARDTQNRNYKKSRHQGIVRVLEAFKEAGIAIPAHQYRVFFEPSSGHLSGKQSGFQHVTIQMGGDQTNKGDQ